MEPRLCNINLPLTESLMVTTILIGLTFFSGVPSKSYSPFSMAVAIFLTEVQTFVHACLESQQRKYFTLEISKMIAFIFSVIKRKLQKIILLLPKDAFVHRNYHAG